MKEFWKDIEDYEGLYQVSNRGRVKSLSKKWISGNGRKHQKSTTLMTNVKTIQGYLVVALTNIFSKKVIKVHRLVAQAFIPNPENKPEVNHKDGNKMNNSIENLEWVTKSENIQHAFDIGIKKSPKGEKCGASKLKNKQITEIRNLKGKLTQAKIAKKFNVSQVTICNILNDKNWKNDSYKRKNRER